MLAGNTRALADMRTEVDNTGLGGIVRSLQLGNVDNVAAHGGSGNKAAVGEVLQLVAKQVSALVFLTAPVSSSSTGTVPSGVKIGLHDVQVVLDRAIDTGTLGPWDTGIGDENIEAAAKVFDSLVNSLLGLLVVAEVSLVGLGWRMLADEILYQPASLPTHPSRHISARFRQLVRGSFHSNCRTRQR